MGLTLLAGPANAGKVALLLERYLADISREPVLIVPNRSDVERVERDLLGRCGALLGGSIGTFDDLFERIAAGNGGARAVAGDAQRALLLRRVVAVDAARGSRPVRALLRLRGRARDDDRRAGVRPARPGRSRRRPRRALPRVPQRARSPRALGRRPAPAVRGRPRRRRPRGLGRPPGLRLRVRGPDGGAVAPARGARRPVGRDRLAAVRAGAAGLRRARADGRRSRAARGREHRGAAAALRRVRASGAGAPRARAVLRCRPARAARRRRDPVPRGGRLACDARARRRRGARPDPLRHGARGDPRRLPLARPGARAARDGIRRARRPVRARRRSPPSADAVRPGAAVAAALRLARGRPPRPVRVHPLALLRPPARARGLPRGAAPRARRPLARAGRGGGREAAWAAARLPRSAACGPDDDRGGTGAGGLDAPRRLRPRRAAGDGVRAARPARLPGRPDADGRARALARARRGALGRGAGRHARAGARPRRPGARGARRGARPPAGSNPPGGDRVRARARGGVAAPPLRAVGVPRRRSPPRARRQGAARQGGPGRPRPLSLLHRVHARLEAPVPRPRGGDRRRRAPPAEPVLGRRAGRSRSGRRDALDDEARALRARLAGRGRSDRPRAGALARVAGEHRSRHRDALWPARRAGSAASTAPWPRSPGRRA